MIDGPAGGRTNTPTGQLYRWILQHMPVLLFVGLFLVFGLLSPQFLGVQSLMNIVKQASYIGILAVGMTFLLLTAGIDLSVGANMYVSAAAAGLLIEQIGVGLPVGIAVCVTVGVLFGLVNGLATVYLGIAPFIVTLGTLVAGRGVGHLLTGSRAVSYPDAILQIGSTQVFGVVPLPVVLFAIVAGAGHILLTRTGLGRRLYAIGHDKAAAEKAGVNTERALMTVYVACGVLAALGGLVSVAQMGIVNPGFGEEAEFDVIAASVLGGASLFGGRGTILPGTVLGTVMIEMIRSGMVFLQVEVYLQPLVIGAILFLAVLIDSIRNRQLERLGERTIRTEE